MRLNKITSATPEAAHLDQVQHTQLTLRAVSHEDEVERREVPQASKTLDTTVACRSPCGQGQTGSHPGPQGAEAAKASSTKQQQFSSTRVLTGTKSRDLLDGMTAGCVLVPWTRCEMGS